MSQGDDLGAAACGLTNGYVRHVKPSDLAVNYVEDIQNDVQTSPQFNVAQVEAYMLQQYPVPGLNMDDALKVVNRTSTVCSHALHANKMFYFSFELDCHRLFCLVSYNNICKSAWEY